GGRAPQLSQSMIQGYSALGTAWAGVAVPPTTATAAIPSPPFTTVRRVARDSVIAGSFGRAGPIVRRGHRVCPHLGLSSVRGRHRPCTGATLRPAPAPGGAATSARPPAHDRDLRRPGGAATGADRGVRTGRRNRRRRSVLRRPGPAR